MNQEIVKLLQSLAPLFLAKKVAMRIIRLSEQLNMLRHFGLEIHGVNLDTEEQVLNFAYVLATHDLSVEEKVAVINILNIKNEDWVSENDKILATIFKY